MGGWVGGLPILGCGISSVLNGTFNNGAAAETKFDHILKSRTLHLPIC